MQRDALVQATRASGDPTPLLAAAARSRGAERAFFVALADAFGADVAGPDVSGDDVAPSLVDADDAGLIAREHLVRLDTERARRWIDRASASAIGTELHVWCAVLDGRAPSSAAFEAHRRDARAA